MADPVSGINISTIEKSLADLGLKVSNIYSLLQAKQAAELAIGNSFATSKLQEDTAKAYLQEAGLSGKGLPGWSRSSKGGSPSSLDIVSKALASVKTSAVSVDKALKNLTQTTDKVAKTLKDYSKDAPNFSYSLSRGKYAAVTPFMSDRAILGKVADVLTAKVGGQWKNAALDPDFDLAGALKNSKLKPLQKLGLRLGRGLSGAAGFASATGLGALGAAGIWMAGRIADSIKTGAHGYSLSLGMAARGAGQEWSYGGITDALYRGRLMGTSLEEAKGALTHGQALGLSLEQSMSALAATKAFGISGAPEKVQVISRRFLQNFSDASRYFASLTSLTQKTGLSLEELSNASQEAASTFRGLLDANAIRGVLGKYGKLVQTGEFSWGDIYSSIGAMQKMSPTQQIAAAHFAAIGGYKFKSDTALGRAYEVQRMGGGQIGQQAEMLRSAIKGVLSAGGRGSWSSLSVEDKYAYGNMILGQMGLTEFYKHPGGEALMEKIMSKGTFTKDDQEAWEKASMTSAETIATQMQAVIDPLNSINTLVASLASRFFIQDWAKPALDKITSLLEDGAASAPKVELINRYGSSVGIRTPSKNTPGGVIPIEVGGS